MKLVRLVNTISHLRPIQVYWRLILFINRKLLSKNLSKRNSYKFKLPKLESPVIAKDQNYFQIFDKKFNETTINWNCFSSKLKNYHLNYFDYIINLNFDYGDTLIHDWISKNLPKIPSDGWEPYPISLRLVNWIKFYAKHNIQPDEIVIQSLIEHGHWLFKQREYHLLANHLLKNIVALLYWGYVFNDKKILSWSLKKLGKEVQEQLTKDGMHYEFSPTYHALSIQDLMDCYNLLENNSFNHNVESIKNVLKVSISKGFEYVDRLNKNKNTINIGDVNYEGVPGKATLFQYAQKLNVSPFKSATRLSYFPTLKTNDFSIMLVNSPFSPKYNAAHSHADKLSVLLWHKDKPILVDTGNYDYTESKERNYSRSVKAHNTIQIDDYEQADLWSAFRVGKRGVIDSQITNKNEIACNFTTEKYEHKRSVKLNNNGIMIIDEVTSKGEHKLNLNFHFSPNTKLSTKENNLIIDDQILFKFETAPKIIKSDYFPKMFQKEKKPTVELNKSFTNKTTYMTQIRLK